MAVRFHLIRLLFLLACLPVLVIWPQSATAQEWKDYQLGEARFQVPADWTLAHQIRDSEYAFASSDSKYRLLAFWWFPDEPLLGYDDIVRHQNVKLGGRDALFIHTEMGDFSILQLAFEDTRENGEKFLMNLEVTGDVDQSFYNDLIARIAFDSGTPAPEQPKQQPQARAGTDAPLGEEAVHPDGGFALRLPANWTSHRSDPPGRYHLTGLSEDRQRLVMVVATRPDGGRDALTVLEEFETLFYQGTAIPQSIDYDGEAKLGGIEGRAMQLTARLYGVDGIRLPYTEARVDLFRGGDTSRAFWMAVIRPLNASPQSEATLRSIAGSFRALPPDAAPPEIAPVKPMFGAEATAPVTELPPAKPVLPNVPQVPLAEAKPDQPPVSASPKPASDLANRVLSITRKSVEKTKPQLDAERPAADTPAVASPVPEPAAQPDGDTPSMDVAKRIQALTRRTIDKARPSHDDGLSPQDPELAPQPKSEIAEPETDDKDDGDVASRVRALTRRTIAKVGDVAGESEQADPVAAPAPPAAPPAPSIPIALDRTGEGSILPGDIDDLWQPYSSSGGDFEAFGKLGKDGLFVNVPEGHNWAISGVVSGKPVLFAPFRGAAQNITLSVSQKPQEGAGLAVALVPPTKKEQGHWNGHDLLFVLARKPDQPFMVRAYVERKEVAAAAIEGDLPPEKLVLSLSEDGVFDLVDGDGQHLLSGVMKHTFSREGWHVIVASHAAAANAPVKLAISDVAKGVAATLEKVDPAAILGAPQTVTLFDASTLGRRWQPYRVSGGDFQKMAQLADGALTVHVPKDHGWAQVGIRNSDAVIWPDRLGGGGHVDLDFEFDTAQTNGFVIAMSAKYTLDGNKPPNERFLLFWRKTAEGIKATASGEHKRHVVEADNLEAVPGKIRLRLSENGVRVVAEGFPDETIRWNRLASGQGLRLYVFAHPSDKNEAAKMALKSIKMTRTPGVDDGSLILPPGVDPLPSAVLFEGARTPLWETASVSGAKFEEYGRFEDGKMIAEVPAKFLWGKTGLLSAEPVVVLDHRVEQTPYEIRLKVDPALTSGMQVMVSTRKEAGMWGNASAAFSLIRYTDSVHQGDTVLALSHGPYKSWGRQVDKHWLDEHWDGTVILRFGNTWAEIALPGGSSVRGGDLPIRVGSKLFMTVYAHPEHSRGGSSLALERIEGGWATPQRMSKAEAIMLADDDTFDPEAFLDALAEDLSEEHAQ